MRAAWTRELDDWAKPEIRRFERVDAEAREARGDAARERAVVFVGSSIFREWREVRDFDRDWEGTASRLAGTPRFINRAFGGSTTTDVLRHASSCVSFETRDVRAVVYYCGSNDISVGVAAKTVRDNFVEFEVATRIRARGRAGARRPRAASAVARARRRRKQTSSASNAWVSTAARRRRARTFCAEVRGN